MGERSQTSPVSPSGSGSPPGPAMRSEPPKAGLPSAPGRVGSKIMMVWAGAASVEV